MFLRNHTPGALASTCPIQLAKREKEQAFTALASQYNAIVKGTDAEPVYRVPNDPKKRDNLASMMQATLDAQKLGK